MKMTLGKVYAFAKAAESGRIGNGEAVSKIVRCLDEALRKYGGATERTPHEECGWMKATGDRGSRTSR